MVVFSIIQEFPPTDVDALRSSIRLRLGVHKGMKMNNHEEMEMNGMYLSKGKEWKRNE